MYKKNKGMSDEENRRYQDEKDCNPTIKKE